MTKKTLQVQPTKLEKSILSVIYWVGTPISIGLHTLFFIVAFLFVFLGVNFNSILLVVTTIVSLEAIYLALFIQMTVNQHTMSLKNVEEDIDDIQEDIEDVGEDIDKIQEEDLEEEVQEEKEAKIFTAIENQLTKLGSDMSVLRDEIQSLKHKQNSNIQ